MRLFLYRTLMYDDDGDPYDHGVVRAADMDSAKKQVGKRLKKLGIDPHCQSTRIYPLKDRLSSGVLGDWEGEKPLSVGRFE